MEQQGLLRKTVALAKTGDQDAFENFYILTAQDTYGYACALVGEGARAEKLLADVYVMLYRRVHTLPSEEETLRERICDEVFSLVRRQYGVETEDFSEAESFAALSEERAAAIWMAIEEKAGFGREEELSGRGSALPYLYSFMKIILTVAVLAATALILYGAWAWLQKGRGFAQDSGTAAAKAETAASREELVIEQERLEPGWEQKPDGKLYYVTKDGQTADGAIALGKQILTFSRDGQLLMIGTNKSVTENPGLSFDEETRYEVRDGSIYMREPDGREICVVGNGHVVQADVRCGFLWYISKYRIPNTDRVKTSIYRADSDGGRAEELYSTENIPETDSFQVTGEWLYFISDGELYRKNLKTEETEFLKQKVEHYFAWEDTAYYMNDRTLESVSVGTDYSGIEAGYRIEQTDAGFVLYDAAGAPVTPDGNGETEIGDRIYRLENGVIRSVRPAARRDGESVYFIGDAGRDKKIFWRNASGSQGMLRQEGLTADSLCIAGEWLYYSARTAQYGDEAESQIYRIHLQSMELETVGVSFRGYMRNLYYFDGLQTVFGEYIPSLADPEDIHGAIAAMPVGGVMGIVNDAGERPAQDGSDMLEFVMADGSQIYCLYHRFEYDYGTGELHFTTTEPVVIRFRSGANSNKPGPGKVN